MKTKFWKVASLSLLISSSLYGQQAIITSFDVPGAGTDFYQGTWPTAINPARVITGYYLPRRRDELALSSKKSHRVPMNADYWEKRTVLIRDGAIRMLSLSGFEEVDYWRDELKSNRRNSREIELMTWAKNAVTLRGRADYGRIDEVAEYLFQFKRTSEGKLLKFGAIAFCKSEDGALARQVIDTFMTKNCPAIDR